MLNITNYEREANQTISRNNLQEVTMVIIKLLHSINV